MRGAPFVHMSLAGRLEIRTLSKWRCRPRAVQTRDFMVSARCAHSKGVFLVSFVSRSLGACPRPSAALLGNGNAIAVQVQAWLSRYEGDNLDAVRELATLMVSQ